MASIEDYDPMAGVESMWEFMKSMLPVGMVPPLHMVMMQCMFYGGWLCRGRQIEGKLNAGQVINLDAEVRESTQTAEKSARLMQMMVEMYAQQVVSKGGGWQGNKQLAELVAKIVKGN
jgi:hypothetical protein